MLIEIEGRYINPDKIVYVTKIEWPSTWKIVIWLTNDHSVQIITNSEEEANEKIQTIINKINNKHFNNIFTRGSDSDTTEVTY